MQQSPFHSCHLYPKPSDHLPSGTATPWKEKHTTKTEGKYVLLWYKQNIPMNGSRSVDEQEVTRSINCQAGSKHKTTWPGEPGHLLQAVELNLLRIPSKSLTDFNPDKNLQIQMKEEIWNSAYWSATWEVTFKDAAQTVFTVIGLHCWRWYTFHRHRIYPIMTPGDPTCYDCQVNLIMRPSMFQPSWQFSMDWVPWLQTSIYKSDSLQLPANRNLFQIPQTSWENLLWKVISTSS
jgi:hypothetical protein